MEFVESDDGSWVAFELIGADATSADASTGADAPATSTATATPADPAIVIPGGPCRGPEYLDGLAGLAEVRPLAVLHLRGTAPTDGLSRGWWADAADAIAVADRLGLERFDVLAHSAGTRAALALTARFPGRARSLALITPAAAWLTGTPHDGDEVGARRGDPLIDAALASMEVEPTDEAAFQRAWEIEAPAGYAAWGDAERRHATIGGMSFAAATAWFRDTPEDAVERILHAERPPALVLAGAEDILSGVETVRAYAASLGAELRTLDGCGHYPWVERPAEFRAALDDWIAAR